jgi:hypothetical protein
MAAGRLQVAHLEIVPRRKAQSRSGQSASAFSKSNQLHICYRAPISHKVMRDSSQT